MVIESLTWIPTNLPLPSLSGLSQLNLGQKNCGSQVNCNIRFSKEKDVSSSGSQSYLISSVLSRPFSVYRTLQCVPIREKNILEGGSWSQKWTTFWLIVMLALARTRVCVWRSRVMTVTFTAERKSGKASVALSVRKYMLSLREKTD